jgi:hypothetical protein
LLDWLKNTGIAFLLTSNSIKTLFKY